MFVSIEGNIGSGKSSIIEYLKTINDNRFIFIDEPLKEWIEIKDKNGINALECFYCDQKKNSFCFQVLAYITRLKNMIDAINNNFDNKIIITERSIETDKNIFAKMLYDDDLISSIEWVTYNYWFDTFKNIATIDKIIYIHATPEKCFEQIKKRNRVEEANITLDYLKKCDNYHKQWISGAFNHITINGHDGIHNIRNEVISILNNLNVV